MKQIVALATAAVLTAALALPSAAVAADCSIGDSGVTYNRAGVGAKFSGLRTLSGMNCASGRYVLNKWLRRSFARSAGRSLPTSFYDGYVTWDCFKRTRLRWQCNEYDSGTKFRFYARIL